MTAMLTSLMPPDGATTLARQIDAPRSLHAMRVLNGGSALSVDVNEPVRNRLLGALSAEEYMCLAPCLERVHVKQRQLLFEQGELIRHVYFPETMVVSLVTRLEDGGTVEVGTTGYEGMTGLPLFLGDDSSTVRAFAQIPGRALRMDADSFTGLAGMRGAFHRALLRYTLAFLTQVTQTAACSATHLLRQRCARWLLTTHDRVDGDQIALTHEFLAFMLGVRRAGVTVAMNAHQDAGLINYTRGRVTIVDRAGLEDASCECYRAVRAYTDGLLPRLA